MKFLEVQGRINNYVLRVERLMQRTDCHGLKVVDLIEWNNYSFSFLMCSNFSMFFFPFFILVGVANRWLRVRAVVQKLQSLYRIVLFHQKTRILVRMIILLFFIYCFISASSYQGNFSSESCLFVTVLEY